MQLIPAIDLLKGDVVRLRHGDFNDRTTYELSAAQLAEQYAEAGARWLHVVDLAASRDGEAADHEPLFRLLRAASQQVQTGGGVRSGADIEDRFLHGAKRVVVGTLCVTETPRFIRWLGEYGADRLVSALDVKIDEDGVPWPRTYGWTEGSTRNLWDLLDELADNGLQHLLCTDISKDGAMIGPNLDLYTELAGRYPMLEIQASGGVAGLRDLKQLKETGAAAVITGKALLEGCFTVQEALEALA
jgi:phosphoribosylformimino-5-aminoimidazole carboxamide ribotide isomerase